MSFLKKYSYIVVKLFLNQFAIALFGVGLAFACVNNNTLLILTSVFSIIFYLFLQYAIMWEVGAKDGITATARHTSRGLWRGFVMGLMANVINFIFAIMVFTRVFTGGLMNGISRIGQPIALVLHGMYQGVMAQTVGGVKLNDCWWMYFIIIIPAVAVAGVAYIIGNYGWHFTNILIPKNKDVKHNGRPNQKKDI